MWKSHRIASITYHKHPAAPWDEAEFADCEVTLACGVQATMPQCGNNGKMPGDETIDSVRAL